MFARASAIVATVLLATAVVARPTHETHPDSHVESTSSSTSIVNAPAKNTCNNVGDAMCCDSLDYASPSEMQTLLNFINTPVDTNTLVGHGCSPLTGASTTCNAQAVCCEDSYQGIGVSCNNFAA